MEGQTGKGKATIPEGVHADVPGGRRLSFGKSDVPFSHAGWSDGSCFRGLLGADVVLESEEGETFSEARQVVSASKRDSTSAELLSLGLLLSKAREMGVRSLQVGLDSFEALNHMERVESGKPTSYPEEVKEVLGLVSEFERVELLNIANRKNAVADGLSRKAIGLRPR